MKKLTILISVLALSACGGGSGGGAGTPGAVVTPNDNLTPQQRVAITSNAKVTGMNSFVVIGGSNPTVNSNARAASTGILQSDGGTRYDLSNVEFKTASTLMNLGIDDGANITFKTEDGRINKIIVEAQGKNYEKEDIELNLDTTRKEETNIFAGTPSYKTNGNDKFSVNNETVSEFGILYESGAQKHGSKLQYADWGVVQWGDISNFSTSNYFAGGYAVKEIESKNINNTMTFTGVAEAVIRIGEYGDEASIYNENNKFDLSTTATLKFDDGKSILSAKYDKWYDVTATMDNDGKLTNLEFTNGDKGSFYNTNEHDFKWHGNNEYTAQETYDCGEGCSNTIVRDGFIKYYGDDNNPAEAVGVIRYAEKDATTNSQETMRFDMGFGGTRQ